MQINAIILAAGKGTRMHTELPKCAYPVAGKPMVNHIIKSLKDANIDNIYVVVGFKKEVVMNVVKDKVTFIEQPNQNGTGDAIRCCKNKMKDLKGYTLIFPGDMPLIDTKRIKDFVTRHRCSKNDFTIMTTLFDNPFGYGRIYRENKRVVKIVEEKEATEEIKKIKEVNTGLYCINNEILFDAVDKINNNNSKGEYYLTDIVDILSSNYKIGSYKVVNDYRLIGINDLETLNIVEGYIKQTA